MLKDQEIKELQKDNFNIKEEIQRFYCYYVKTMLIYALYYKFTKKYKLAFEYNRKAFIMCQEIYDKN